LEYSVDSSDSTQLPSWLLKQLNSLLSQKGHAWLLHGPSGLGQYALALELAQAWLCDRPTTAGACHDCPSCHAIAVRSHPDLCVLMPEVEMLERQWPLPEKAQSEIDDKKRKASKEIRVDAMRGAIEFAQRTSAKGRGKVVLVYPAEMMNHVTANALLKTLEEPPGDTRFILATQSAHLLLPTIRSRCMSHAMLFPLAQDSIDWMVSQGVNVASASVLLAASGDRPMDAVVMASGLDARKWTAFPNAMFEGDVSFVRDWGAAQLVDALHKLCHDQMATLHGAAPRFFPANALVGNCQHHRLSSWSKALGNAMRSVDHPYNPGLMQEALVNQARLALHSDARSTP
jgi:DNA polymerase-3 subunit delta'